MTNFVWVEPKWPKTGSGYTQFEIAYMPVFRDPSLGGASAVALEGMIQVVEGAAQARSGGLGVYRGNFDVPFELTTQGTFNTMLIDLRVDLVRNLYYFGHGAPDVIGHLVAKGSDANKYISAQDVANVLKNKGNPFTTTNSHPFRFVFIDGCKTAAGDLCLAFGIPKQKKVPFASFYNKGLRLRAYCGWSDGIVSGYAGALNQQHVGYIGRLFHNMLEEIDPNTGFYYTLNAAAVAARQGFTDAQNLIIYGYEDLDFFDTIP